jgi:hypothetical protein
VEQPLNTIAAARLILFVPAKDFHEDVRDINHQVHRVIPADDVKCGRQVIVRRRLLSDNRLRDWF